MVNTTLPSLFNNKATSQHQIHASNLLNIAKNLVNTAIVLLTVVVGLPDLFQGKWGTDELYGVPVIKKSPLGQDQSTKIEKE